MGTGNICVFGKYEGLYFVDFDYIHYYRNIKTKQCVLLSQVSYDDFKNYEYDMDISNEIYSEFIENLKQSFLKKFPSFRDTQNEFSTILENHLFEIQIEDNNWSYAIKLIQKEPNYNESSLEGLQKKHYKNYLNGLQESLFEQFDEIGIYTGSWTHNIMKKELSV